MGGMNVRPGPEKMKGRKKRIEFEIFQAIFTCFDLYLKDLVVVVLVGVGVVGVSAISLVI